MPRDRSNYCQKLMILDVYGRPFDFLLPDGNKKFKSLPGTTFTAITVCLLIFYIGYRSEQLWNRTSYQIVNEVKDYGIDSERF